MSSDKIIELSVDDIPCIRRSAYIRRNAVRGNGFISISKAGFGSLVNDFLEDEMKKLRADNAGLKRFSAIIGETVKSVVFEEEEKQYCIICFDNCIDICKTVAIPCGHCFCCVGCMQLLDNANKCIVCRSEISKFGSAEDLKTQLFVVAEFSEDDDEKSKMCTIDFTVAGEKKKVFRDRVVLVATKEDLTEAFNELIEEVDGLDKTHAISLTESASKCPSLFWSLYDHALHETSDLDLEKKMMKLQCELLGLEFSGSQRKRARR